MKFVNPRNDVAFKKIFGNEEHKEILISFLNAALDLTGEKEIQEIEFLSPLQTPRIKPFRDTLIDVRATNRSGVSFFVESKLERKPGMHAYLPNLNAQHDGSSITQNENFPRPDQVIFIGILDFKEFATSHYVTNVLDVPIEADPLNPRVVDFYFIELPKFQKQRDDLTTILEKWLFFLKDPDKLTRIPDHADTPALREAYHIINQGEWSKAELEVYDYWDIRAQDERGAVQYALNVQQRQTARKMLADGLDVERIAKCTGLTADEVAALAQEHA